MKRHTVVKCIFTAAAILGLAAHLIWPQLKIDAITLGLLLLAFVPWLAPVVKTIEVPGFGKVELQSRDPHAETLIRTIPAITPGGQVEKQIPLSDSSGFYTPEALAQLILNSGLAGSDDRVVGQLQIFRTEKQRTWLIATSYQIFCILDDAKTRSSGRLIQWRMPLAKARPVRTHRTSGGNDVVDLGEKKNWLYSSSLHPDLEQEINELLDRAQGATSKASGHT